MEWLLKGVPRECRIFMGSAAMCRKTFKGILAALGLPAVGFTPGPLRAGGATHLFLVTRNISLVRFTGRWRSGLILFHYFQEAASVFIMAMLPADSLERVELLAKLMQNAIFKPPRRAWSKHFSRTAQHQRTLAGYRLQLQLRDTA